MNCPNCSAPIPNALIAQHFGSIGGGKSRRVLDSETARLMVWARTVKGVKDRLREALVPFVEGPRGALAIKRTEEGSKILLAIADKLESYREPSDKYAVWFRLKNTGEGAP